MMSFDWTTFVLEILNFLVLVWLLQRLLYRPALTLLDARQQRIRQQSEQAEQTLREAETLRQEYQTKLADWDSRQQAERHELDEELARLRADALDKLQQTLAEEEAKYRSRSQSRIASREAALAREAAVAAYGQTATLLQRLASVDLTLRIAEVFLEDLAQLTDDERTSLCKAAAMLIEASAVNIATAHPLPEAMQQQLNGALSVAAEKPLQFSFKQDPSLIAGLRAVVGECQLHANLADELAFFRRQANHER
ncbi:MULTISPECIES: F0F1 ATP synthase subunit delta [Methylomonas]|uniref:F0F1 ATP synthase subunit delta n=1 Tax=Methylomonas TaxID=416 RepID=UPI0012320304|nr:F0F1 ATP synthase subunit delta [Methylomonas rhizoryzae]